VEDAVFPADNNEVFQEGEEGNGCVNLCGVAGEEDLLLVLGDGGDANDATFIGAEEVPEFGVVDEEAVGDNGVLHVPQIHQVPDDIHVMVIGVEDVLPEVGSAEVLELLVGDFELLG
jgi:hypothetical protein